MVDVTQLRSIPTARQLIDLAKGLAGQAPRSARVALVVRPDQTTTQSFGLSTHLQCANMPAQ